MKPIKINYRTCEAWIMISPQNAVLPLLSSLHKTLIMDAEILEGKKWEDMEKEGYQLKWAKLKWVS
jgi:hypothetical protein